MSEYEPITREQLENEVQVAVGKLILSHLEGRRDLARAIFNALVPYNGTPRFNVRLKVLTELTLDAAGGEDDPLEYRPGERPRLKTVQPSTPTLPDALSNLPEKL